MSTKRRIFTAVRWTAVAAVARSALQFLQVSILARLLLPSDFGLMALSMAVIAFAQIFADMGVSNAIIHHQEVDDDQLSSLYWLNVAAGALMMVLVMTASPALSHLYKAPQLEPVLMLTSLYFLINAVGQQLRVMAEKEMTFNVLARIEIASAFVGAAVAIGWALTSPSVIALVAGLLSSALTMTSLCWLKLSRGWRPSARLRLAEIRRFLHFGGYTMANNVVNTLNSQADIFIGGRALSTGDLGFYSLPRDLSLRVAFAVNPIVTRVALPAMAIAQHDRAALRNIYLKSIWMTASVNFPLYAALAVFSADCVLVFFGARWLDAVPVLRVLALWGMIRSIGNPVGSLLFATGRADLAFKWNLGMLVVIPPVLWAAASFGTIAMAIALLSIQLTSFVPGWAVLIRPLCGATLKEYAGSMLRPLVASAIAAAVGSALCSQMDPSLARLVCGVVFGGIAYLLASWMLNRDWLLAMMQLAFPHDSRHAS